jgi:4-hydroxy-tetrahydrodipicolinate synthase
MGADGVISVLGNAMPERMSSMIQQASFGQTQESREMHARLAKLIDLLFDEGNPTGIKVVLHHLGWCGKTVRLPLTEGTKALTDRLYAAIAELDGPST